MVKRPRLPREIKRSTAIVDAALASGPVVRRRDPRQVELFTTVFVEPCKPTLRAVPPSGVRWSFEIKHDGYRAQAHVSAGQVRVFTKSGFDWAARMPSIAKAMASLPCEAAVIDGEAVMVDDAGVTNFFALHGALARKSAPQAFLYAFDLLHLDGQDLRGLPCDERRLLLEDLLIRADQPTAIRFSETVDVDGPALIRSACEMGLEGVIAKLKEAPYRSGRSETWLKIKCTKVGMFGVTGYEPAGRGGVASLAIAELQGDALVPAGSVGSGLTDAASCAIRKLLDAGRVVVVEVEYRGRTPSGGLRHPVFLNYVEG